jgi:putative intracellular protease/amidase
MSHKILFVLTSHRKVEDSSIATGWFLPEFAHPYYTLAPHAEIVVASPDGGEAPLSQQSIDMSPDEGSQRFLKEKTHLWKDTTRLENFKGRANEFDAVFYVGGGGRELKVVSSSDGMLM